MSCGWMGTNLQNPVESFPWRCYSSRVIVMVLEWHVRYTAMLGCPRTFGQLVYVVKTTVIFDFIITPPVYKQNDFASCELILNIYIFFMQIMFFAEPLVAQVLTLLSSFWFFSPHSSQSYLAAIDSCFSLAYLLSERHHGKRCCQTPFKLHVNNLNKQINKTRQQKCRCVRIINSCNKPIQTVAFSNATQYSAASRQHQMI